MATVAQAAAVKDRLLDWYAREGRDLPWRRTRDPYAILVAEVMLQQTQVDRVIPKWHAWLAQFPTLLALASATRGDAIRAWQGLGYNLRAVRLHEIAVQVHAQCGGQLPRDVDGLLALRGVGPYTAHAVACFAYEQPVAMVDTNVRRVLARLFAVEPVAVEELAAEVVPARPDAWTWNQALMDLGATLCRSSKPLCLVCPLVELCAGPKSAGPRLPVGPLEAFKGSRRYYRGRLVEALRAAPHVFGMPLADLVGSIAKAGDEGRVVALIERLAAEGLLQKDAAGYVRLPD